MYVDRSELTLAVLLLGSTTTPRAAHRTAHRSSSSLASHLHDVEMAARQSHAAASGCTLQYWRMSLSRWSGKTAVWKKSAQPSCHAMRGQDRLARPSASTPHSCPAREARGGPMQYGTKMLFTASLSGTESVATRAFSAATFTSPSSMSNTYQHARTLPHRVTSTKDFSAS